MMETDRAMDEEMRAAAPDRSSWLQKLQIGLTEKDSRKIDLEVNNTTTLGELRSQIATQEEKDAKKVFMIASGKKQDQDAKTLLELGLKGRNIIVILSSK